MQWARIKPCYTAKLAGLIGRAAKGAKGAESPEGAEGVAGLRLALGSNQTIIYPTVRPGWRG